MADERKGAKPRNPSGGAEPHPASEARSFGAAAPARKGAGDPSAEASPPGRHLGPEGDPAEGKP